MKNLVKWLKSFFFPPKQREVITPHHEVNITATAYHEAGHCIVAYIFFDRIKLNLLTINKEVANQKNKGSNGGLLWEWRNIPNGEDYEAGDYSILISLAGICSKTIFIKGNDFVKDNLGKFRGNHSLLNSEGAVDDYKFTEIYSQPISGYFDIKKYEVEWSAFRWVFEYLLVPEVWKATELLANALLEASTNTLNKQEIETLMEKSGFDEYLQNNKQQLLAKRYPLSQKTLRRV